MLDTDRLLLANVAADDDLAVDDGDSLRVDSDFGYSILAGVVLRLSRIMDVVSVLDRGIEEATPAYQPRLLMMWETLYCYINQ